MPYGLERGHSVSQNYRRHYTGCVYGKVGCESNQRPQSDSGPCRGIDIPNLEDEGGGRRGKRDLGTIEDSS
jgi:hypothetical protein